MGYVHYEVNNYFDSPNSCKLLYVTQSVYDTDWRSFPHAHYFTELFYVLSGNGTFHVEDEHFSVQKGSLVLINPHVRHTEKSSAEKPLEYIVLGIEGIRFIFDEERQNYGNFHEMSVYPAPNVLLRQMEKEMREKKPYFEKLCQSMLELILINLMRNSEFEFALTPPQHISNECNMVKQYIDSHLQDNINLDLLSKVTHLNKFYLSHKFTEELGISIINYLLEKRIQNGKELLRNTDLRISMIAQLSGFSSQSYFTQAFTKSTGIGPAKYREAMQLRPEALEKKSEGT